MKNVYRTFFANVKDYIKFKPFLSLVGINQSAFSRFMKNEMFDYEISEDKLKALYDCIIEWCEKIA